jgi:hypothetical protein
MDLPSPEDVELKVKAELSCLGARAKESLYGLYSFLFFHPRLYCKRTRVAGCGNPFHILVDATEPSGGVRVVDDCPWYPQARVVEVSCVAVIHRFVVGNRPADFTEAPVRDRPVAQDYIAVGRSPLGTIFPEIFSKDEIGISAGTDIAFVADGKPNCTFSMSSPEVANTRSSP